MTIDRSKEDPNDNPFLEQENGDEPENGTDPEDNQEDESRNEDPAGEDPSEEQEEGGDQEDAGDGTDPSQKKKIDESDLSQDNNEEQLKAELEQARKDIEVLEKRVADKDAYITWLKDKVMSSDKVIDRLNKGLKDVEDFFNLTPGDIDVQVFNNMKVKFSGIKSKFGDEKAKAKLQSIKTALDVTEDESEEIDQAIRRDGYTAETINSMTDKEAMSYLKSVLKSKEKVSMSQVSGNSELLEIIKAQSAQIAQLIELQKTTVNKPATKVEVSENKSQKPSIIKSSGKVSPTKNIQKDESIFLEAERRV